MYDIGISEIAATAKYEDTEQRSINKCVYKPYNGKLGDYLTVYLEMHDSRHREESSQNRMKIYYSRLKELNL